MDYNTVKLLVRNGDTNSWSEYMRLHIESFLGKSRSKPDGTYDTCGVEFQISLLGYTPVKCNESDINGWNNIKDVILQWCDEQFGYEWIWNTDNFYFKTEEQKSLFILRWIDYVGKKI